MKLKFFSIPVFENDEESRDLNCFLSGHRVIDIEKHLVHRDSNACWAVCVSYHDGAQKPPIRKGKVDYKEVLSPAEFSIYAALRDLRKSTAEKEGVQVFVVFTNAQLAAMVRNRVTTSSGLREIEGIGSMKVEKYGERFLELLGRRIPELYSNEGSGHGEASIDPAR